MFNPNLILTVIHPIALLSWLALLLLPDHLLTKRLVNSGIISALFSLIYCTCVLLTVLAPGALGSFDSLGGIRKLFSTDWGLLAAWIHFMAFDLLIAIEVMKDFNNRSLLLRTPLVILLFVFGPLGWLMSRLLKLKKV